jgi:hypothetical protein
VLRLNECADIGRFSTKRYFYYAIVISENNRNHYYWDYYEQGPIACMPKSLEKNVARVMWEGDCPRDEEMHHFVEFKERRDYTINVTLP